MSHLFLLMIIYKCQPVAKYCESFVNSEKLNSSPGIVCEYIPFSFFPCWNIPNNEEKHYDINV